MTGGTGTVTKCADHGQEVPTSRRADAASEAAGLAVPGNHSGVGPASMARLHALAELERHVSREGTCRECGDPWPCEVACLAAFTLQVVAR